MSAALAAAWKNASLSGSIPDLSSLASRSLTENRASPFFNGGGMRWLDELEEVVVVAGNEARNVLKLVSILAAVFVCLMMLIAWGSFSSESKRANSADSKERFLGLGEVSAADGAFGMGVGVPNNIILLIPREPFVGDEVGVDGDELEEAPLYAGDRGGD